MTKLLIAALAALTLTLSSGVFASSGGSGGQPNIPCFKDGKMIETSIEIYKCEALGGTIDPDEAGVDSDPKVLVPVGDYLVPLVFLIPLGLILL